MTGKIHRDVTVSIHGRLTLPAAIRRAMNLDGRRRVRVSFAKGGEVFIRLLPDVMSYFGSLKNPGRMTRRNGRPATRWDTRVAAKITCELIGQPWEIGIKCFSPEICKGRPSSHGHGCQRLAITRPFDRIYRCPRQSTTFLPRFAKTARNNRDLGDRFERLILRYLELDPIYVDRFSRVWMWNDWPQRKRRRRRHRPRCRGAGHGRILRHPVQVLSPRSHALERGHRLVLHRCWGSHLHFRHHRLHHRQVGKERRTCAGQPDPSPSRACVFRISMPARLTGPSSASSGRKTSASASERHSGTTRKRH